MCNEGLQFQMKTRKLSLRCLGSRGDAKLDRFKLLFKNL